MYIKTKEKIQFLGIINLFHAPTNSDEYNLLGL